MFRHTLVHQADRCSSHEHCSKGTSGPVQLASVMVRSPNACSWLWRRASADNSVLVLQAVLGCVQLCPGHHHAAGGADRSASQRGSCQATHAQGHCTGRKAPELCEKMRQVQRERIPLKREGFC